MTVGLCAKIAYGSKHSAKRALKACRDRADRLAERQECRIYRCDHCRAWHLTSIPLDEWRAGHLELETVDDER